MSIKSTIAALAASPFLFAGAAFAGPYVNVESNISYPDGDYGSATTDLHIGYEGSLTENSYVQKQQEEQQRQQEEQRKQAALDAGPPLDIS